MTPEQFCYWLQGRAELMPDTPPSESEWKMIAEHLGTVFKKVTNPLDAYRAPVVSPSLGDVVKQYEQKKQQAGIAGWPDGSLVCKC